MVRSTWGDRVPEDVDEARSRLLDAVEACLERYGVAKTTVEDVAAAAGVSRATVYRYFEGGRDELILGVLTREADRFLTRLQRHVAAQPTLGDALVEGVLFTMKSVRQEPKLAMLFVPEVAGYTGRIVGTSEALWALTDSYLRPILLQGREAGEIRSDLPIDDAVEWLLRVILSMLSTPSPVKRTLAQQRAFLRQLLLPSLLPIADLVGSRR